MSLKASVHGPNRRQKRTNDISSSFSNNSKNESSSSSSHESISFQIKSLERFFAQTSKTSFEDDACLFHPNSCAGRLLLRQHADFIQDDVDRPTDAVNRSDDPILIHFHNHPVYILRAKPLEATETGEEEEDVMYLSEVHGHNHKVCVDTTMKVTCCSRPSSSENYAVLSLVGVGVHFRNNNNNNNNNHKSDSPPASFHAKDIARELTHQTFHSVLTINEVKVITLRDTELVCRIDGVRIETNPDISSNEEDYSAADETILDEPYRGRVSITTQFWVSASNPSSLTIIGEKLLPEPTLPHDVIHITTSDKEWFPVRKALLAPCIKLTKYVQAGRGKYDNIPTIPIEERSDDAPSNDDCPHCKVDIDSSTFDRVLLFLTSLAYPQTYTFSLDLSELHPLDEAAHRLGLIQLAELCSRTTSSFESRVRKDRYIRLAEVRTRNRNREYLLLLDGMVLDVSNWLDEHPGGAFIIPTQALNVDCTLFFEMYHVSRQAFLYLKTFYVGELAPEDRVALRVDGNKVEPSEGFLRELRGYTKEWRVIVEERVEDRVHKSL